MFAFGEQNDIFCIKKKKSFSTIKITKCQYVNIVLKSLCY